MDLEEYERYQPHMYYTLKPVTDPPQTLVFLTPNKQCAWRVESLDTKEPDTIEWLNTMKPGLTLWDVGANMGQYALIAAKRGLIVHAFEPESQNFSLLCRNIGINGLGETVTAWPMAVSDVSGFDFFYAQNLRPGGSCNSYGEAVNFHLQPKEYRIRQGAAAITGDGFGSRFGFPDYVKIDVDGLEHKVLNGMRGVLQNVRSVLVEFNTALPEHLAIYNLMETCGLYPDIQTADLVRRTEGTFTGIGNVIFFRNPEDFLKKEWAAVHAESAK